MDSFKKRVALVRNEIVAKKSKHNDFGNYNYRSCEDIYDGAKTVLEKYSMNMDVSDELVVIGDRFYIKATAKLTDWESSEEVVAVGYARESLDLPKMSQSQVTGTASSYARKYACSALLLLDDVKDADSNEFHAETTQEKPKVQPKKTYTKSKPNVTKTKTYTPEEEAELKSKIIGFVNRHQMSADSISKICKLYSINSLSEMKAEQCEHYISVLTQKGGNIDE